MKTNPLKEGALTENSAGLGTVTRKMVRARAVELAVIDGLLSSAATKSHFAQAKRELTGEPDMDPKDAILESAPESERRCLARRDKKFQQLRAKMKTKKVEAITKGWSKEVLPKRGLSKVSKLPELPQKKIYDQNIPERP